MNVEIISVGTELLLGDIVNTNAQYISRELAAIGINVYRQMTLGDNIDRLVRSFEIAFERADTIITTGGLGPTGDDITKEAVAKYFGQEMVLDQESWKIIEDMCLRYNVSKDRIPENNIKQAMFPREADIIPNKNGTAPGAVFKKDGKRIIVMPGPPREMKAMFKDAVLPILMDENPDIFLSRYVRFFGIGESGLEIELMDILNSQTNPTVALYAKEGEVLVRVTARAKNEKDCLSLIDKKIEEIKAVSGKYIYMIGDDSISESQSEMERLVGDLLLEKKKTIAVAESCTGGLIASYLVANSGISDSFMEACVTYTNDAKVRRLGVSPQTLDEFGAVSSQTAEEMAMGIAKTAGADIGLSTTGIAGPGGGSEEKPVGLVYIGLYYKGKVTSIKRVFSGDRRKIRERAARTALNEVRQLLEGE
ncbi:competence/damage-inducible protein A [Peptostreptococcus stomatis]|uniref:competence/damage-inducible protein A n=1 Tax=Peptostreptococcus stomatis TaxID=341694 RepID=UPI0026EF1ABF|nr:competence/damage-inducible protein A [Peptostreptococcus stomatis]